MDFYILLAKFSFALLLLCAEMKVFLQFEILFRGQHVGCWVRGDPHRQPTPRKKDFTSISIGFLKANQTIERSVAGKIYTITLNLTFFASPIRRRDFDSSMTIETFIELKSQSGIFNSNFISTAQLRFSLHNFRVN
jgi:hypothetical protein